jgi:hypothetical protein
MCYDLSESDANEEQCSGPYYSDALLKELDGYPYAEKCRDVHGEYKWKKKKENKSSEYNQ